jgi:hypothetical protein
MIKANQPLTEVHFKQIAKLITGLKNGGYNPVIISEITKDLKCMVIEHDNDNNGRMLVGIIANEDEVFAYYM